MMASSQEDVVFDSWEDIDETEVSDRKLKEILPRPSKPVEPKSNNKSPVNVILLGDDALRTQYVPPEPTVTILKRPSKDNRAQNGDCKPRQQFKTLKQREQEYAEARLRILGEAHSSEKEEKVCTIQNKSASIVEPVVSATATRHECDSIVRVPRGPDGTRGFLCRR